MVIGVLSDTHHQQGKPWPNELYRFLEGVDRVIHAGDFVSVDFLNDLMAMLPVDAVAGNCDPWPLQSRLGRVRVIDMDGVRIGIVHGDGFGGSTLSRAKASFADESVKCIVFGHSHEPYLGIDGDRILINPGSAMRPRFQPFPTVGRLMVDKGVVQAQLLKLNGEVVSAYPSVNLPL